MSKIDEVREFWDAQARQHGVSSLATMPDQLLKNLELENISRYLKDGMTVVDLGCGNGFSTFYYANRFNIDITGQDYSEVMIRHAIQALAEQSDALRERVRFMVGDVRDTGLPSEQFDVVITDRCLINLVSREDQARAIAEIHRILKPSGIYLMCEDTEQGLANLNRVRSHAGLYEIAVRWHNLYLDEQHLKEASQELFQLEYESRFSSFYYLASRVINAKIAQEKNVEPRYDDDINRIAALCSSLDVFGDCGPLKLFVYRKI